MLKNEYAIKPRSVRSIGTQKLDYMNETGKIPGGSLTINVGPIDASNNKRLASHLRSEMEATAQRAIREYS